MSDVEQFEDLFADDDPTGGASGGAGDGGDAGNDPQGAAAAPAAGAEAGQDAANGQGDGGDGDGAGEAPAGEKTGGTVPVGALKAVREEKKDLAAKVESLTAQVAQLTAAQAPAPAAPAPAPARVPTVAEVIGQLDNLDPDYSAKLGQVIEAQMRNVAVNAKLETSREAATREFGAEEVNAAFEYFNTRPRAESDALLADRSPFHAAVAVYRKSKALAEIGDDPAAFVERTRQRVMAELQAAQGGQAQTPQIVTTGGASLAGQPNLGTRSAPEWSGPETLEQILGG